MAAECSRTRDKSTWVDERKRERQRKVEPPNHRTRPQVGRPSTKQRFDWLYREQWEVWEEEVAGEGAANDDAPRSRVASWRSRSRRGYEIKRSALKALKHSVIARTHWACRKESPTLFLLALVDATTR